MTTAETPLLVETPASLAIPDLLTDWAKQDPSRVLMRVKSESGWLDISAAQLHEQVTAVARGLVADGLAKGDRVAIMSRTRPEWTICDFAIWYAAGVPVSIYETSSAEQAAWILEDSDVSRVFVETSELAETIRTAAAKIDREVTIWVMTEGGLDELTKAGSAVSKEEIRNRCDSLRLDSLSTIIYTSGTTGKPKGVELTHSNFVELCRNAEGALGEQILHDGARTLLFMPLAHVFARFVSVLTISAGIPIGHVPDIATLLPDIATFQPTFILSVPRVFEKVYNSSEQKAAEGGKVKIFNWAASVAQTYSRSLDEGGPSRKLKFQHAIADRLVLKKIREALGGQVEYAISGGAPLGERLNHFFRGVGVTVLEGYGLTETTAPVGVNLPNRNKIGTVGPALPGISLKIAEDGEILAKGIAIFSKYHNNEAASAEALTDGWFHTGDLGELDADGYLKITGRKKEIIVTAGGKNVVPSQAEDRLRAHPLISQCVVVGDKRPFIAVLLTLDEEMLPGWLSSHGLEPMSVAEASRNSEVLQALQEAIDHSNTFVSRAESIRRFEILEKDFTIDDYLTPKMSVKRNLVLRDFAERIDELYQRAAAERAAERAKDGRN